LYSKLECNENRKNTSSSSHITWNNHKCGDKCRKSATFDGLDVPLPTSQGHRSHHEHSHRHTLPNTTTAVKQTTQRPISEPSATSEINPFSTRTRAQFHSLTSMPDSELTAVSSDPTIPQ